jgi:hypothetical protein
VSAAKITRLQYATCTICQLSVQDVLGSTLPTASLSMTKLVSEPTTYYSSGIYCFTK